MGHNHDHDHDHDHDDEHSELGEMDVRVRALETLLTEKGYVDPAALDELIDTYQTRIGPRNGARVVARAWIDPEFRDWLQSDATAAIASLGYGGRQGEHMVAVEQTDETHNLVVCTLCSCYPWPVLGLPPTWYKSAPYRSRVVSDSREISSALNSSGEVRIPIARSVNVSIPSILPLASQSRRKLSNARSKFFRSPRRSAETPCNTRSPRPDPFG